MIFVVDAGNRRSFQSDLLEMHRQRKVVFVDRAGWDVPVIGDREVDAHDRKDTIYLLAKDRPDGPVLASVRLLTTTGAHLMCDLFDPADQQAIPRGPTVWEASRFCTSPQVRGPRRRHALLWEIICGVMETALFHGIDQVVFAAGDALLPLALDCGWDARPLGPRLHGPDGAVTAVAAKIDTAGLQRVRQFRGVRDPATRLGVEAPSTRIEALSEKHPMEPMPNAARSDPPPRTHGPVTEIDRLRTHGYVIFERLLADETVDRVCAELEPWFASTPRCRGDFYGWNTTRLGSVLLKSPTAHSLVLHPLIRSIADTVLGPHCDWYQLNLTQAVRLHPGQRQQVPHRDEEMWPCQKNGVEHLINVMWALSDFTERNGATLIWPRSQFNPPSRTLNLAEAVVAEMPRGSALVYLGSVTHCGGANRADEPRTGLILSYCLGWLKQYENAFLSYPPQLARNFPQELRDLIGYRIHRPNLGGYEGQDPSVLFDTDSHNLPAVDAIPEDTARQLEDYYRVG